SRFSSMPQAAQLKVVSCVPVGPESRMPDMLMGNPHFGQGSVSVKIDVCMPAGGAEIFGMGNPVSPTGFDERPGHPVRARAGVHTLGAFKLPFAEGILRSIRPRVTHFIIAHGALGRYDQKQSWEDAMKKLFVAAITVMSMNSFQIGHSIAAPGTCSSNNSRCNGHCTAQGGSKQNWCVSDCTQRFNECMSNGTWRYKDPRGSGVITGVQ